MARSNPWTDRAFQDEEICSAQDLILPQRVMVGVLKGERLNERLILLSMKNAEVKSSTKLSTEEQLLVDARRTAFVARFIVLRESRRTRAHRVIEKMSWSSGTSAEQLAQMFRQAFIDNGDNMTPVERDIRRALAHADRSLRHFVQEYASRSTISFIDSLCDYERSNSLLFGEDEQPKSGGWRLIRELIREREQEKNSTRTGQVAALR